MADAFTVWAVPRLRTEGKGHNVLESVIFVAKRDGAIKIGYPDDFEGHRGNRASGDRTFQRHPP
jgi:hypothetical protein